MNPIDNIVKFLKTNKKNLITIIIDDRQNLKFDT